MDCVINAKTESWLRNIISSSVRDEGRDVESVMYRRHKVNVAAVLRSLYRLPEARGFYKYFVEHDKLAIKQEFYLRSKLVSASIARPEGPEFFCGLDFMFALLSDNDDLIKQMAMMEKPEFIRLSNGPRNSGFDQYMLNQAILGRDDVVASMIEDIIRRGGKKEREEYRGGGGFYSLLLNRDKAGLEKLIQEKHARLPSSMAMATHCFACLATIEAKLCWYRGIPVQIESSRVPMDLMPIEPLDYYDDVYEFLKPGWVPPKPSIIGDLKRWWSKK